MEFIETPNGRYIAKDLGRRFGIYTFFSQEFLPFEEAREFVRKLKFKNCVEWNEYCKSGNKPDNIPSSPCTFYEYKDWVNWGDWIGTGKCRPRNKVFLPFEEAREFVRSLKLENIDEWNKYCELGRIPSNIPFSPYHVYKLRNLGWTNWIDFLGKEIEYVSFEEAKKFVRGLGIIKCKKWYAYCLSHKRPKNIPYELNIIYKDEWTCWGDFLGTTFLSFEEARKFARELKLKNVEEWLKYCRLDEKLENIPLYANESYEGKGWLGWKDFLGTEWVPFEEVRKFVRDLGIKNQREWESYVKLNDIPYNIPHDPRKTYKNEWNGWHNFLGTKRVYHRKIFISFTEAREIVMDLGLKNCTEWEKYCKTGKRPKNIPFNLRKYYENEWNGWKYFLGVKEKYVFFEEAREFVRKLNLGSLREWHKYSKSGKRPKNIPSDPYRIYKEEWISWGDFLGTGNISYRYGIFLSFEEAREFARKLNLRSQKEWKKYSRSGKKPKNIPSAPYHTYKYKGWINIPDFLGYEKNKKSA